MAPHESGRLARECQEFWQRPGSAVACCRVGDTECSSVCMGPFEGGPHCLHYLHHSLAWGQITGKEHSPTLQQKVGLKIYWAWPRSSEQDHFSLSQSLPLGSFHKPLILLHQRAAAAAAKLLQSCLTLCDCIDGSQPGSLIPGILQARTVEWVAISFSNAWKWKVKVKSLSWVWLLVTPWTAAYQAPRPMGFCRQEYWSGVPLPSLPSEGRQTENHNHRKQSNHMDYRKRKVKSLSGVRLFATPWTVAYQAPPSMGFSRQ